VGIVPHGDPLFPALADNRRQGTDQCKMDTIAIVSRGDKPTGREKESYLSPQIGYDHGIGLLFADKRRMRFSARRKGGLI
jgi:hypothetical protein